MPVGTFSFRMWSCGRCTAQNSPLFSECRLCQSVRDGEWQCSRCSSSNLFSSVSCVTCRINRVLDLPTNCRSPPNPQSQTSDGSGFKKLKATVVGGFRRLFSRSRSTDLPPTSPPGSERHDRQWKRKRTSERSRGRENEGETWKCAKCTFDNEEKSVLCEICGDLKPEVRGLIDSNPEFPDAFEKEDVETKSDVSSQTRKETWTCDRCTCLNLTSVTSCEACGNGRDRQMVDRDRRNEQGEIDLFNTDRVACHFCTSMNPRDEKKCKMCHRIIEDIDIKQGGSWRCKMCSCNNDPSATRCSSCGSENRTNQTSSSNNVGDMWKCSHCTFLNSSSLKKCEVCGNNPLNRTVSRDSGKGDKEINSVSRPSDSEVIACHHCTFMNQPDVEKCGLCQKSLKEERDMRQGGWWRCDKCRYNNEPRKTRCSACDTPITAAISHRRRTERQQSKTWCCVKCTFSNPEVESQCQMCSHGRTGQGPDKRQRKRAPTIGRQESWSMELKRQVDEQEAVEQWKNIMSFCRMVRRHTHYCAIYGVCYSPSCNFQGLQFSCPVRAAVECNLQLLPYQVQ